jgi:hypothetical protein
MQGNREIPNDHDDPVVPGVEHVEARDERRVDVELGPSIVGVALHVKRHDL